SGMAEEAADRGQRAGAGGRNLESHQGSRMTSTTAVDLGDLESKAARGEGFTRADAERMLASPDLVSVGLVGQAARTRRLADRVTYGRVGVVAGGEPPATRGDAGEVRLVGAPASADEAAAWVRRAAAFAAGAPLTGFRAHDLLALAGGDFPRT